MKHFATSNRSSGDSSDSKETTMMDGSTWKIFRIYLDSMRAVYRPNRPPIRIGARSKTNSKVFPVKSPKSTDLSSIIFHCFSQSMNDTLKLFLRMINHCSIWKRKRLLKSIDWFVRSLISVRWLRTMDWSFDRPMKTRRCSSTCSFSIDRSVKSLPMHVDA